ncbi:hypothetical protein M758_2G139900 [Ceratodon purpureus]|nr:hypothetical protein M758_2G139900 [Ceratodon purpureus]
MPSPSRESSPDFLSTVQNALLENVGPGAHPSITVAGRCGAILTVRGLIYEIADIVAEENLSLGHTLIIPCIAAAIQAAWLQVWMILFFQADIPYSTSGSNFLFFR